MNWLKRKFHTGILLRFELIAELLKFLWQQKLWWLVPMVIILVLVGLLIVFAGSSPLAPFVYTLF